MLPWNPPLKANGQETRHWRLILPRLGVSMPPYVTVDFLNFIQAEHQSEISNVVLGDYYDTGSMMIPE
jgi:hypothetical protein